MSNRRGNQIRGPKSALTDFLASNNISAAQIRNDYERRQAQAATAGPSNQADDNDGDDADAIQAAADAAVARSRKRKRTQAEAIDKIKNKKSKGHKGKKTKGDAGSGDDDEDEDFDDFIGKKMYKKAAPKPGQFENCGLCGKRFTVTPYSKAGPDDGLLCLPCGKTLLADATGGNKPKKAAPGGGKKRRKVESDRLDGRVSLGARSLQQICVERIVQYHADVDDFGDLPGNLLERLSEIFSKKRVMKPKTLPLFLRSDLRDVVIPDCAYLETKDFKQILATTPNLERLALGNACQFKDETMVYMGEMSTSLKHLQLYAANLVTSDEWSRFFLKRNLQLESLKLQWLDASFDDQQVIDLSNSCLKLTRLKLERCRRIGAPAVEAICRMEHLKHLSLQMSCQIPNDLTIKLLSHIGPNLETLSLDGFHDADDQVAAAVRQNCHKLSKLRISDNDRITDAAYAALFTEWTNPPLRFIDMSRTRDVDNNNPCGPDDPVGVSGAGFEAMMKHSADKLEYLNVASCRHIPQSALLKAFNPESFTYPLLQEIDISFVNSVDTAVLASIFKSCPKINRVIAFGCFGIDEVVVPRGVVVIGVPRAQDAIERFGGESEKYNVDVDQAVELMDLDFGSAGPSWMSQYISMPAIAAAG